MESLILGIAGSVLGSLIGVLAAWVISAIGIQMPPPPNSDVGYTAMIRLSLNDVAAAFSIGVAATILAALLPARRVSHTPVVEALRQN
jgi:putative ABC transport system permease protein